MDPLARHITACNNAVLPGERVPFLLADTVVGWLRPELAQAMLARPGLRGQAGGVRLDAPERLPELVSGLAAEGWFRLREEAFDVRADPGGPVLGRMDRGALPSFGVLSVGVHVNGIVHRPAGPHLWVAFRSHEKHLDPGKLDQIVAGGVPSGMTPEATLAKEAAKEAALPATLAAQARPVARIAYAMEREEGLRRDLLFCYDLNLPEDFKPHPADDEVERFELWPIDRALATARESDAFKFNVNLVLIDLFLRRGLIEGADATRMRTLLGTPARGAPGTPVQ